MTEQIRIVIVGHVDHGKSTFIGRLLHDAGALPPSKLAQLDAMARRRGATLEFANVTDALQAERDQNVTIDTTQIWFRAGARDYVLIDAPGHREFLKNMVTGAAHADAACLLIDAAEGIRDQTRRHSHLLQLLGVRQLAVLVNKMDIVGYDEGRFLRVADDCTTILAAHGIAPLAIIPIAARHGDNVASRGGNLAWWAGPTALDIFGTLTGSPSSTDLPLRFPVQDVYRFDQRRIVAGQVESGTLTVGQRIHFCPGNTSATVRTIEAWSAPPRTMASAGESIGITLEEPVYLQRGNVGADPRHLPYELSQFQARLFWLGRAPLLRGRRYPLKLTTQTVDCWIDDVQRVSDAATLETVVHEDPSIALRRDDVAEVVIRTTRPIACDAHTDNSSLGRFVLMSDGEVAGGGVILDGNYPRRTDASGRNIFWNAGKITHAQRVERSGHQPWIVWLTGLSGAGKSTIATELERELFDRGRLVYVLDGDNVRHGLCADLGFSDEDRSENIRRIAEVASLLVDAGFIVITAFISPSRAGRAAARAVAPGGRFLEVYVNAPLDVCERRDVKGLYARARAGQLPDFTGISSRYEPPAQPDLELRTDQLRVDEAVKLIVDALQLRTELPPPEFSGVDGGARSSDAEPRSLSDRLET